MKKLIVTFAVFIGMSCCTMKSFAQVGTGPAPTLTTTPDKFPSLNWTASVTSGVTYNIYRGTAAGGTKGRINTSPVSVLTFRDGTAAFGVQNFYVVEAQRTSDGVESGPSNEVSGAATQGSPAPPTGLNVVLAFLLDIGKAIYAGLKAVGGFLG